MMPEPEDDTPHYCLPAYRASLLAREWTCPECGAKWALENAGRESRWYPVVEVPECTCESMSGRFGAHRPECPWQVAFEEELAAEKATPSREPIEVGWYAYSGGAQNMVFHLRETGQWSAHFDNGTAADCAWGYIEQALGVWDLVRIDLPGGTDG